MKSGKGNGGVTRLGGIFNPRSQEDYPEVLR